MAKNTVTDAVSSTKLCPEVKPWHPAVSRGVSGPTKVMNLGMATQRPLCPAASPWYPALPQVQTKAAVDTAVTTTKRNQRILDLEHLESFGPKQTILISIKRRICSVLATSLNMGRATTHSILAYSVADAMGPLRYLPALILEWISSLVAAAWSTTKQT